MRYVLLDRTKPGMTVGKSIWNENRISLVTEGTKLTESMIRLLYGQGYAGIFIEDEISEGIQVEGVIDESVMLQAMNTLQKTFVDKLIVMDEINALVEKMVSQIMRNEEVVLNIIRIKDYHDYTYSHCVNVGILASCIAARYGLGEDGIKEIMISGMLHDIGKADIPLEILDKKGKLTPYEYELIKKHSQFGYDRLKDLVDMKSVTRVGVLQHHERWDGCGYPLGFAREEISLYGRILAVADVYDALTNDRPYHKGMLPEEAMRYLLEQREIMFDAEITNLFASCVAVYPPGTLLKLDNGRTAIVVKNHPDNNFRPTIRMIPDKEELDLREFNYIQIKKVI